jgi:hypothetical protein
MQTMKENREEYEQLADRAARLLGAVANAIMKASPEKLKGMEGNTARLLMCVVHSMTTRVMLMQSTRTMKEIKSSIDARLQIPTPTGRLSAVTKFVRAKGKDVVRVSVDQEQIKKLGQQLDRAIEEFGVRTTSRGILNALLTHLRWPPRSEWS